MSIEIDWARSSAPGLSNGSFQVWTDGVSRQKLTGIDNDEQAIGSVQWGLIAGLDASASGKVFLDQFESRRVTYIGP